MSNEAFDIIFGKDKPITEDNKYPILPQTEVDMVAESSNKVIQRMQNFSQKYVTGLEKNYAKFNAMYNNLIAQQFLMNEPMEISDSKINEEINQNKEDDKQQELSVHAQCLISEVLSNLRKNIIDMSQEHKHPIHHLVSRCGKTIDNRFYSDLNKLIKNEKEIETDPINLEHANRLILEHLIGLGRTEVAETFVKESEKSINLPHINNFEQLEDIMSSFRQNNYLPAIQRVKLYSPHNQGLLFRLQCQHIIQLLETSDKLKALNYVKELQSCSLNDYKDELAHLMFIVISYPQKGPYEYLFHKGRWFALEEELAHALTDYRSSLHPILSAGAKTVPSLMTMRAFLTSTRPGPMSTLPDELPCNVPIPAQVHSSFCCPILKVQSTENNPPVRLCCGHVISTDAMNKLVQQNRNNRLKCPYCPLESMLPETKILHF